MFIKTRKLSIALIFLFIFSIFSNLSEINSLSTVDENFRIRNLLDSISRFQGKGYSNKIEIKYDHNKFTCSTHKAINPKEYSFLSNSGYSICSDKIFENFNILAEKINSEINQNLEPKLFVNVNFMNEFKQVLYFAYYITYIMSKEEQNVENPKDKFFDAPTMSFTQREIFDNFSNNNFNLFDISNEDLKILNNYLHTIVDINIMQVQQTIDKILGNIEKALGKTEGFKNWILTSRKNVKYFIGIIWREGIHIDFDTFNGFAYDLKTKLDKTEYQEKIQNIRGIHVHTENQGVLCLFNFVNFCGLPKKVMSAEEESSFQIKKDCVQRRIMFYNSKNFGYSNEYSFLKEKNWSNLDYLLTYGNVIRDYYLEHHKIYINFSDEEQRNNLADRKHLIENFITKPIYQRFQNVLLCKSCNPYLSFNLKGGDYNSLKKLYEIISPFSEISQKLNIMGMLYENLYSNLQIKIDFENKNRLKNFDTDFAIIKIIGELEEELINISEDNKTLINNYVNRIEILKFVQNSRNVLLNFSEKSFEDAKVLLVKDIRNLKDRYV